MNFYVVRVWPVNCDETENYLDCGLSAPDAGAARRAAVRRARAHGRKGDLQARISVDRFNMAVPRERARVEIFRCTKKKHGRTEGGCSAVRGCK